MSMPDRQTVIVAGHNGDELTVRAGIASESAEIREVAWSALQRLGRLTPTDLINALDDASELVIARAAELSARADNSADVDERLIALLRHSSSDLAEVAAWALGERHQTTEGARQEVPNSDVVAGLVSAASGHPDALVRESAVAALGCIGDPSTLPAVLRACSDKATVRRRAIIALAAFEGPEVDAALAAAKNDRDWQVRQAAEDLSTET